MPLSFGTDQYFMNEALKQAVMGYEEGEIPVGAVVVCHKKIVARAHNQTEQLSDVTAHAEMLALTSAFNYFGAKYLPECTLYVTLEPCVMCGGALNWAQVDKVVYGASDPQRGYKRLEKGKQLILHPKTQVISGIMADECSKLVVDFFKKLRNN
jgi:tRNA(adenine34) deaminase